MATGIEIIPIKLEEMFSLTDFGAERYAISFGTVTMECCKYICIRDTLGSRLIIIDTIDLSKVVNLSIVCESAVVNPWNKTIAITVDNKSILKIFDMETETITYFYAFIEEDIRLLKWLSCDTLGIVTQNSVYHWKIGVETEPKKIFDKNVNLKGCQIINYKTNSTLNWSLLIGLSAQTNRVIGSVQLYSSERNRSQIVEAHSACFAGYKFENDLETSDLIGFVNKRADNLIKLHAVRVGQPRDGDKNFTKISVDVCLPPERVNDFPVSMQIDPKHGLIYVITMYGYLNLFDIETGISIYTGKISDDTVFATAVDELNGGVMCINKKGQVLKITVDENNIILYLSNVLKNNDLAVLIARRNSSFKGADDLFINKFNDLYGSGKYTEAAKLAALSPNGRLRTRHVIESLKNITPLRFEPNETVSPLLRYFAILLDTDRKLNHHESIELCKIVLNQNKKHLLEKWLKEDKLFCTEELGDLVKCIDIRVALSIYLRSNKPDKVIKCFIESKQYEKIVLYCKKIDYKPNYLNLLKDVLTVDCVDSGVEFAKILAVELLKLEENEEKLSIDIDEIVNAYTFLNLVRPCTAFLLEILKENKQWQGNLQTKLIEINLLSGETQVADAILCNRMFSHYDRNHIGRLCEKSGLLERALEHYSDLYDIKRAVTQTHVLNDDWLVDYFKNLSADDALECLKTIMMTNIRQNLQLCVKICNRYYRQLTVDSVINLFESFKCYEGLFYFLQSIIDIEIDRDIHFKYIESACNINRVKDVERICRESNRYDPEKVKNFLKDIKLPDQMPLIIVCDRFDFVNDLIWYLHKNNLHKYIEIYVQKVNASRLPIVVGYLLDVDCDEDFIKNIITTTNRDRFSVESLVYELEKRNRLTMLSGWLESIIDEGSTDTAVHNAIAKIYADGNDNAERFLKENPYYESIVIGKYCEKRDPRLACIVYERGRCDLEFINVCYENDMFKLAARYLIGRRNPDLWKEILVNGSNDNNKKTERLIDQVVQTALSETRDIEEISVTVKAFMNAGLPARLIQVLEKIVLDNPVFSDNKNLQNLLILTAIKCDKNKVIDYVRKLDNYDSIDVATVCINNQLFEEAFCIYQKFNRNCLAVKVLIENLQNLDRACEFAERVDESPVWSLLGKAQLKNNFIKGGIDSFIRADDPSYYVNVVETAQKSEKWSDLLYYLEMCNKKMRESYIQSELIYTYAKTDRLADLEEFISVPNNADIIKIADRCFDNLMYDAAKILYGSVSSYAKLSITLAKLKKFQDAVDNARKANCTKTWIKVCFACLDNNEYRLAQICGLNIVIHADELQYVIDYYENNGYFIQLIDLLETATSLERAHMGIFTELSVLYARYRPEKMKEHVELFWSRINVPKALKAANESHLWDVSVFLYDKYEDYDNAISVIMDHPTECWRENHFKDLLTKVSNIEFYYKAIKFYLTYKPLLINDLLAVMSPRIDHTRSVSILKENACLLLVKPYLLSIQSLNLEPINTVVNDILITEEDYRGLKTSIDLFNNFDGIFLAHKLEKHELIEFRRISAYLYRNNNRWNKSIDICKEDGLFKDATKYAAESKNREIAEELLNWFLINNLYDYFTVCLFQCYDLLRPDFVIETAWKFNTIDYSMPFLIQVVHEYIYKVDKLLENYPKLILNEEPKYNNNNISNKCMLTSSETKNNNLSSLLDNTRYN